MKPNRIHRKFHNWLGYHAIDDKPTEWSHRSNMHQEHNENIRATIYAVMHHFERRGWLQALSVVALGLCLGFIMFLAL